MSNNGVKLTMLQNNFVMAYTSFGTDTYSNGMLSIKAAGSKAKTDNALMASASEILSYPKIKAKIEAIEATRTAQLVEKTGFTIEKAQQMYCEDREFARKCNQAGAATSATTGICRLYGMDKDAGGKDTVTVINVVNYAGSAGVKPPKLAESGIIDVPKPIDNKEIGE